MDGLLLDTERNMYAKTGKEVSEELGYPLDMTFLRSMMGKAWDLYIKEVSATYDGKFPTDEYLERYWARINNMIETQALPLRPGAKEVLDYCKENGYLMAIGTSTPFRQTKLCLENTGLYDYFDFILTGDQVSKGKPDPEIFLSVVEHFGVNKDEAIVLEDGHNGAQAALNGGLKLILVEDMAYVTDEDREKASLYTRDLHDAIDYLRRDRETAAGL